MDAKRRLLSIRLGEQIRRHPAFAERLGISVTVEKQDAAPEKNEDPIHPADHY